MFSMLGYMNKESFRKTLDSYKVTFLADREKIMDERRDIRALFKLLLS